MKNAWCYIPMPYEWAY